MWRIKQLHTVNLTYQARFFVRGERPTELLNINFSSKFDKDLGIYYYFCNKWSVKTTLKQCHASVLNNISSIHQPLKQHTHTYTTLTPWNFHLKSSSNDWNPRSATFFLYHTRRPGWTISLSLATPPTQPRTQVSERTIIVTTLNHRWPQGQPWSGRVSLKWFFLYSVLLPLYRNSQSEILHMPWQHWYREFVTCAKKWPYTNMDPQIQGNFFLQSFKSTHFVSEMLTVISLRDRTHAGTRSWFN